MIRCVGCRHRYDVDALALGNDEKGVYLECPICSHRARPYAADRFWLPGQIPVQAVARG
jgi:DNA-directed RNA polymerase subunit RPC12/RpoP